MYNKSHALSRYHHPAAQRGIEQVVGILLQEVQVRRRADAFDLGAACVRRTGQRQAEEELLRSLGPNARPLPDLSGLAIARAPGPMRAASSSTTSRPWRSWSAP